ncbi:MAG: hypothetical protein HY954_07610 [Deltaproteobacteria bacterium]|nr:hypothetical protein [Deltaproteobacteria bacterium]
MSDKNVEPKTISSVANVLLKEVQRRGYSDSKACAKDIGVSYELFRKVLAGAHIPRDEQLLVYANKLALNVSRLVRLAHYERAPKEAKQYLADLLLEHSLAEIEQLKKINKEASAYIDKIVDIFNSGDEQLISGLEASVSTFYAIHKRSAAMTGS